MKDYYNILEIEKGASREDIKKAFRKLASKYHPDKKTGDESKFKEISEAYAILSNDKRRAEYDTYGRSFSGQASGGGGFGGFDFSGFRNAAGGQNFEFDLNDIFEGFGDVFSGHRGRSQDRGRDISIDVELAFSEAIFGTTRKILLTKNTTCDICAGGGGASGSKIETCSTCNGNGKIRETRQSVLGSFTTVRACSVCNGKGSIAKEKCKDCRGNGIVRKEEEVEIKIPAGIEHGEMIRLTGRGEALKNSPPGDLYVKVHIIPHNSIKRDGVNLRTDLLVKLTDALLGGSYVVETLEEPVTIKIPPGVKNREVLRVKGRGVPHGSIERGDLLVQIIIETPQKLSRRAKKLIEELREEGI